MLSFQTHRDWKMGKSAYFYHHWCEALKKYSGISIFISILVATSCVEGNADNAEACDSGWLDGSSVGLGCLMFGTDPMTFLEANKFCYKNSAHLVEILSEAQMDYMKVELQLRETMV